MTLDAMRALHFDDQRQPRNKSPSPKHANQSMVFIDNSMHVIEPVTDDEAGIPFDLRTSRYAPFYQFTYLLTYLLT